MSLITSQRKRSNIGKNVVEWSRFSGRDGTHCQLYVPNMKSKLNRQVLFVNVLQALFVNVCVGAMFPKIVSFLQLQTNPFFTISATRVRKLPSLIFDSQRNRLKLQLD